MFYYFGYGSNINSTSLRAKGVIPSESVKAILNGYKLTFDVEHWFRHEGGMGNIRVSENPKDHVEGLVHLCKESDLQSLDAMEAYGEGYDRIEVKVNTPKGPISAWTYIGMPKALNEACLPTNRYLNIIIAGAEASGLSKSYIDRLRSHPKQEVINRPSFIHPQGAYNVFTADSLSHHPMYTALGDAVFDMSHCREKLNYLKQFFGGKDMTLFHIKRLDTSNGEETLEAYHKKKLSKYTQQYINNYLYEYLHEFDYVGNYKLIFNLK